MPSIQALLSLKLVESEKRALQVWSTLYCISIREWGAWVAQPGKCISIGVALRLTLHSGLGSSVTVS